MENNQIIRESIFNPSKQLIRNETSNKVKFKNKGTKLKNKNKKRKQKFKNIKAFKTKAKKNNKKNLF